MNDPNVPNPAQVTAQRNKVLTDLMQVAGETMERLRVQLHGLMDVNSVENKVLRSGIAAAALAAAELVGSSIVQVVMMRIEEMFQKFVAPLEVATNELKEETAKLKESMAKAEKTIADADAWVKERLAALETKE